MSNVVPFAPRARVVAHAIDLVMETGERVGFHLQDGEVAVFVEHDGQPVGGLISLPQVAALREAIGVMLACAGGSLPDGAA